MKLLVCVKAVQSKYAGDNLVGTEKYVINPYDLFALNKAVQLKQYGATVTCICMGSNEMKEVLYKCLAIGADEAFLVCDFAFAGSDTYATSYILQKAIEKVEHDYILCGEKSVDGETGQVVYNLASRLKYFCASNVLDVRYHGNKELIIETLSHGEKIVGIIKEPAIIVFNDLITELSVSLFSLKKAQNKTIIVLTKEDMQCDERFLGQAGSKTKVIASKIIDAERKPVEIKEKSSNEVVQMIMKELQSSSLG